MTSLRRKSTQFRPSPAKDRAARAYDRLTQLPGLIGLWPAEIQDRSAAVTLKILALLRRALRSERACGRSGHWTYDLNRHLALAESLKAERAHLRALDATPRAPKRVARNGSARAETILHLPAYSPQPRIGAAAIETPHGLSAPDQPVFLWPILAESSS